MTISPEAWEWARRVEEHTMSDGDPESTVLMILAREVNPLFEALDAARAEGAKQQRERDAKHALLHGGSQALIDAIESE